MDLALGLLPLLGVAAATWRLFALPASYLAAAGGVYAVLAGIVLVTLPPSLPGAGMGPANRVTLLRGVLVSGIAGMVAFPEALGPGPFWWIIGLSTASLILDGVDGWLARRTGTATDFGARFDMELDAFLMLVLSVLVWESGKVGAWVVLIGLLRYLFVAAGWVWRRLRGRLRPSLRRKAVCVVQGVVLLVALGPVVPAPLAAGLAAVGLALLAWSFGADVWWLARQG